MSNYNHDSSWLHGKYTIDDMPCEINTKLPYVAIGEDYFVQGEEADKIIDEIHYLWLRDGRRTTQTAFKKWINFYL